ncbi:hypothetical protein CC79DRAFT_1070927 [Sarocladium strictum]
MTRQVSRRKGPSPVNIGIGTGCDLVLVLQASDEPSFPYKLGPAISPYFHAGFAEVFAAKVYSQGIILQSLCLPGCANIQVHAAYLGTRPKRCLLMGLVQNRHGKSSGISVANQGLCGQGGCVLLFGLKMFACETCILRLLEYHFAFQIRLRETMCLSCRLTQAKNPLSNRSSIPRT